MVYRVNFLTFWITMNIAYALIIENLAYTTDTLGGSTIANDGSFGFLECFAIYLMVLVIYRVFFGGIHIIKFKIMRNCMKKYKTPIFDLHKEVKRLRQTTRDWNESVIESDYALIDEFNEEDEMLNSEAGPGG